jgi:hypothetical protein
MDNEKYMSLFERYVTAHEKLATHVEKLIDILARDRVPDFNNLVMKGLNPETALDPLFRREDETA